MKNYNVGNIVETKEGNKCIILDIKDETVIAFNLSKMEPDTIKLCDIKEKIGDADCTTMIINGKKMTRKKDEDEVEEIENEEIADETVEEKEEKSNEATEAFEELVKLFGKAAIEIGNLFTKMAESAENEK